MLFLWPQDTPVSILTLGAFAVAYVLLALVRHISYKRKYKFPNEIPGGLPFVGNSFQMPATCQGPFIHSLAEKYGEMYVPFSTQ